jgi:zinc transport system permease protein
MLSLLVAPLVAGLVVAALCGPLGSLVVWRRMGYFGETLAHAALLGLALSLLIEVQPWLGVLAVVVGLALALHLLARGSDVGTDTLLAMLAPVALSAGLVALQFAPGRRPDLWAWLFGDLLAIDRDWLAWLLPAAALVGLLLWRLWRPLVSASVDATLARVEGVAVERVQLLFLLLLAVVIAGAVRVVGLLLITALLVIPAATARRLARTPEGMALAAALTGMTAVLLGMGLSWLADLPTGPAIVLAAFGLFIASRALGQRD